MDMLERNKLFKEFEWVKDILESEFPKCKVIFGDWDGGHGIGIALVHPLIRKAIKLKFSERCWGGRNYNINNDPDIDIRVSYMLIGFHELFD